MHENLTRQPPYDGPSSLLYPFQYCGRGTNRQYYPYGNPYYPYCITYCLATTGGE